MLTSRTVVAPSARARVIHPCGGRSCKVSSITAARVPATGRRGQTYGSPWAFKRASMCPWLYGRRFEAADLQPSSVSRVPSTSRRVPVR